MNAVVPLPDFVESADFLELISRKSCSVNTKICKSATPNFGNIMGESAMSDSSRISGGPIIRK